MTIHSCTTRSSERPRLAGEEVFAFLTATEGPTLLLELIHAYSRKSGSSVVFGFIMMCFMDWYCCVNDVWFDSFYGWSVVEILYEIGSTVGIRL